MSWPWLGLRILLLRQLVLYSTHPTRSLSSLTLRRDIGEIGK